MCNRPPTIIMCVCLAQNSCMYHCKLCVYSVTCWILILYSPWPLIKIYVSNLHCHTQNVVHSSLCPQYCAFYTCCTYAMHACRNATKQDRRSNTVILSPSLHFLLFLSFHHLSSTADFLVYHSTQTMHVAAGFVTACYIWWTWNYIMCTKYWSCLKELS